MSATDQTVINDLLKAKKRELDPTSTEAEFFEFFSAEQILRDYSLDPEEIKSGIVGQESNSEISGTDGGIDSMYLLVNGKLIRDLDQVKELASFRSNIVLEVIIIQSKKEKGFGLEAINRLGNTIESIFQIDKPIDNFTEKYNEPLLEIIRCFRELHVTLIAKHPKITLCLFYATVGDSSDIHTNISGKAREIEEKIPKILSTVTDCKFKFIGARDIINLFRSPRKSNFKIKCLNSISDGKGGHVALIELGEYFKLITDGGCLREYLFESNVRDYEGEVEVNRQIRRTLQNPDDKAAFWWLNNGITILARKVGGHSQELVIDDPSIVNGLQTSQEIFKYLHRPELFDAPGSDKRHTLVRIIESPGEELQDKIIRATNSQTQIPPQFLRASEDIQRDIELSFRTKGLHYDRRKNSWRKAGLSLASIVGITELAQSVAAIMLQEPDNARARPSRYFEGEDYEKVFSNFDLKIYVACALLRKRAERFLKTVGLAKKDQNNVLFYILMVIGRMIQDKKLGKDETIATVEAEAITDEVFRNALSIVRPIYEKFGSSDTAAKGKDMLHSLKIALKPKRSKKTTAI